MPTKLTAAIIKNTQNGIVVAGAHFFLAQTVDSQHIVGNCVKLLHEVK